MSLLYSCWTRLIRINYLLVQIKAYSARRFEYRTIYATHSYKLIFQKTKISKLPATIGVFSQHMKRLQQILSSSVSTAINGQYCVLLVSSWEYKKAVA